MGVKADEEVLPSSSTHIANNILELFKTLPERDIFLCLAMQSITVVAFEMVITDVGNFKHHGNPFLAVTFMEILERFFLILMSLDEILWQLEIVDGKVVEQEAVPAHFVLLYHDLDIQSMEIENPGALKPATETERIVFVEATE